MSHRDQIERILSQAGIAYKVVVGEKMTTIMVEEQPETMWFGYSGFSFGFEFDAAGNLSRVGAWEG